MSAELNIPAEALFAGWHEFRYPRPAVEEPSDAFKRGLAAAVPLVVAAELEHMAKEIGGPASVPLRSRAKELRGEQS